MQKLSTNILPRTSQAVSAVSKSAPTSPRKNQLALNGGIRSFHYPLETFLRALAYMEVQVDVDLEVQVEVGRVYKLEERPNGVSGEVKLTPWGTLA